MYSVRQRNNKFAGSFAFLGIFGGVVLVTGFGFAINTKDPTFYKDLACNSKIAGLENKTGTEVSKQMNDEFINKFMCSEDCPCQQNYQNIIEDDIKEDALSKVFKRTWKNLLPQV